MIRAPSPLPEDITYTVISSVVARNSKQLRQLPNDYPKSVRDYYLQVPTNLSSEVRSTALSLVSSAKDTNGKLISLDNVYDVVVQIAQSIKQNYAIKPLNFDESKGDLVSQLIEQGGGEESHFVSTMAVMLRSLGIPTRYVVGEEEEAKKKAEKAKKAKVSKKDRDEYATIEVEVERLEVAAVKAQAALDQANSAARRLSSREMLEIASAASAARRAADEKMERYMYLEELISQADA